MTLRILLAEDDALLRTILVDVLDGLGWQVAEAADGAAALQALERDGFDLLVTDIMMPVFDGLELILALRRRGSQIPVLAISAGGSGSYGFDVLSMARELGADATLAKPFSPDQLIAAIEKLHGRASP